MITSPLKKDAQIVKKGWERSGITEIVNGTATFPSADPFAQLTLTC